MSALDLLKFIAKHPLNRGNELSAFARFARWQICSRLTAGPIVHSWVNGTHFLAKNGETGLTGNIYTGLHEFSDMSYLLHVLRPEDTFVDVGANSGSYSILAGAAIGADGYAFEPVPSTFKRLIANLRLNNIENRIKAFNRGISNCDDILEFTVGLDTVNHAVAQGEERIDTVKVEVTTLDSAVVDSTASMIKIDVEGFETKVIQGAARTLENESLHSVIMELNGSGRRYGFNEDLIVSTMIRFGFSMFSYNPFERSLINLQNRPLDSGNTLFIRNEEFVRERISKATSIEILGKSI